MNNLPLPEEESDDQLSFDTTLLKRLSGFILPHGRVVWVALVCVLVTAGLELLLPYLTREAIDRHIVRSVALLSFGPEDAALRERIARRYGKMLLPGGPGRFVIRRQHLGRFRDTDRRALGPRLAKATWSAIDLRLLGDDDRRRVAALAAKSRSVRKEGSFLLLPGSGPKGLTLGERRLAHSGHLRGLGLIALLFFGAMLLSFLVQYAQVYLIQLASQRVMMDLRMRIFAQLQKLEVAFFDKNPVGRLVTRGSNDVEALNEMLTSMLAHVLKDALLLVGILVVLFVMNWRLALVALVTLPLLVVATFWFQRRVRQAFRKVRTALARINAWLQEAISGIRVIHLFRREEENKRRFALINHEYYHATIEQLRVFAVFRPFVDLMAAVSLAAVIWYGGGAVLRSHVSLGELVAFLTYVQIFFRPIVELSEKFNVVQGALAASERIFDLLDRKPGVENPEGGRPGPEVEGRIEFEDVSFAYNEEDWVLQDVSFSVAPGESVALVGATGAGKTSIISLLCRFYDVSRGRIVVDGVDVREMDQAELRRRIGLVMQDVFIFSGDIRGNIRLAEGEIPDDEVRRAAEAVNASGFIDELPEGYDHPVTERGATLSTGQRQLLSFARVVAFDRRILVLDEATANIDTETEQLIQDALVRLMKDRTSIIIAHRLSTVQRCDRIYVLHQGRIAESGTHQELLARRGVYHRLYQLQFEGQGEG